MIIQFIQPGLIELPTPVTFDQFIQPAKLSDVCDIPHMGGLDVLAAGMGKTQFGQPQSPRRELRLRQANFLTISSFDCSNELSDRVDSEPNSIICVHPNYETNQSTFSGDSGM